MSGNSGMWHNTNKAIPEGPTRCSGVNFLRKRTLDILSSPTWIGKQRSTATLSRDRRYHTYYGGLSLLVFLVDHVAGIIEWKQTVKLDDIHFCEIWSIHARGNTILCFYEHSHGWGITDFELGSDPAMKHFTVSNNEVS